MGYLDNIIIYSMSEKEYLEHLEEIFNRLKAAGLKLKLEKCCFFKRHIQYLGYLISEEGIQNMQVICRKCCGKCCGKIFISEANS